MGEEGIIAHKNNYEESGEVKSLSKRFHGKYLAVVSGGEEVPIETYLFKVGEEVCEEGKKRIERFSSRKGVTDANVEPSPDHESLRAKLNNEEYLDFIDNKEEFNREEYVEDFKTRLKMTPIYMADIGLDKEEIGEENIQEVRREVGKTLASLCKNNREKVESEIMSLISKLG